MVNRASSECSIHLMEGSSVFSSPLTCGSPTMMESWGPGRTGTPPPALPPPPAGSNNGGATSAATATVAQPSTTAPIASPEGVSDVSGKSRKRKFQISPRKKLFFDLSLFPLPFSSSQNYLDLILRNSSQSETTIELNWFNAEKERKRTVSVYNGE